MLKDIWEAIKETFSFVYEKILKFFIKPMYITLSLFCLYCFVNCLIQYEILLAFANLFGTIVFLNLSEERDK